MEETGIDASGVQALKGKKSGTYIVIVELGSDEDRNVGHHGANDNSNCPQRVQNPSGGAGSSQISSSQISTSLKMLLSTC
jgi:hypothetical protein